MSASERTIMGPDTATENDSAVAAFSDSSSRRLKMAFPSSFLDEQPLKLEHKRARNREAASRCRKRKLDRIAALESRVAELNETNESLLEITAILRSQVTRLKQQVIQHVTSGCDVSLSPLLDQRQPSVSPSERPSSPSPVNRGPSPSSPPHDGSSPPPLSHHHHPPRHPSSSPRDAEEDSPEVEDVCLNLTISSRRSPELKREVDEEQPFEENGNIIKP